MQHMRVELADVPAATAGVDGATNVHSKSMTNVIAFDPRLWFVEYLRPGLAKETPEWLTTSIGGAIGRLNDFVGKKIVRSFISGSCNANRAVRRLLVGTQTVDFSHGCAAHALNNVCEDIVKTPAIKESVRQALYVTRASQWRGWGCGPWDGSASLTDLRGRACPTCSIVGESNSSLWPANGPRQRRRAEHPRAVMYRRWR